MTTTLGAFTWSTTRGNPASGEATLASDPVPGYANTLRVSIIDRYGNNQDAVLDAVALGDVVQVSATLAAVTGTPVDGTTFWGFPFTVTYSWEDSDEPHDDSDVTLTTRTGVSWPDTDELVQVLNLGSDGSSDWGDTLDRILATAITRVKSDVGNWSDYADVPTEGMAHAALRMAVMLWAAPDNPSLGLDPVYRGALSGQRRKFGIA